MSEPRRPGVIAIDGGTTQSGIVVVRDGVILFKGKLDNEQILTEIWSRALGRNAYYLAVEWFTPHKNVGGTTFEAIAWTGRFEQVWMTHRPKSSAYRITRNQVKNHLCKPRKLPRNDCGVRRALIDRYTVNGSPAIGRKAEPGPLYGVAHDMWAALAVAVTFEDMNREATPNA